MFTLESKSLYMLLIVVYCTLMLYFVITYLEDLISINFNINVVTNKFTK